MSELKARIELMNAIDNYKIAALDDFVEDLKLLGVDVEARLNIWRPGVNTLAAAESVREYLAAYKEACK